VKVGEGRAGGTTLYIIDDHPVVREGIRMLLEAAGGVRVVGASESARGALRDLAQRSPDVVLLDLDLGEEDGLEALPRILEAAPGARVLVLTALRDGSREEAALRAGARGFVHKDAHADVLLRAVRAVVAGELWFDPGVLRPGPAGAAAPQAASSGFGSLTSREREVVALVVEGLRNEEIARRLGINEKTVRNHLTAVFSKMGVSGRLELVVLAYRQGLARAKR
jgi:DNA-binding NarL/FixJ family response regulator